jgi:hypothetical protein
MTEEVKQPQQQLQPSQKSLEKGRNAVEYTQKFLNMSLQEIWNVAYVSGFEDAMEIIKTDQGKTNVQ